MPTSFQTVGTALRALAAPYELAAPDELPDPHGSHVVTTCRRKPVPALDNGGYLIIGQIVDGLDVAQALSEGPRKSGAQDIPQYPNILRNVKIQVVQ